MFLPYLICQYVTVRPEKVSRATKIEGVTDADSSFDLVQEKADCALLDVAPTQTCWWSAALLGSHQSNLTCWDLDVFCRGSAII